MAGDVLTVRYRPRRPDRALRADESEGTVALLIVTVVLAPALLTTAGITLHKGVQPDPRQADTSWTLGG